ncbi:Meiotically up-regulated protein 86 protein [Coemansia nantahalensis]|uniref:Meiotically up-regulated protein 86 protein n=1 Tax=Coemansia nantahalensis TaxID=2789366 RepID=A0ACC1JKX3_9FUNG|nr:Meiotically up-regulated protein 86 protein [Coemansia nantahalensis]
MTEEADRPGSSASYRGEPQRFRPFADSRGPGWAALAVSLFTLSFYAGAIGMPFDDPNVATLASTSLIVGGLVVFVSGMWAFATNDAVHATIFTLYGSLFGAVGFLSVLGFNVYNTVGEDKTVSHAAGTFWLAWMLISFVLLLGTIRHSIGVTAFMSLLFLSFVVLAGGTWAGHRSAVKAGGWLSFFASLACMYNTFAVVYKSGFSALSNVRTVSHKLNRKTHRDQDSAAENV